MSTSGKRAVRKNSKVLRFFWRGAGESGIVNKLRAAISVKMPVDGGSGSRYNFQ